MCLASCTVVQFRAADRSDQGQRDIAARVDAIDARKVVLAEHDDAHAVATSRADIAGRSRRARLGAPGIGG